MENNELKIIRGVHRHRSNKFPHVADLESKGFMGLLLISSWPPRECGIATYSSDLVTAAQKHINGKAIMVCAIEKDQNHSYSHDYIKYRLNASCEKSYRRLAEDINSDDQIDIVLLQHEFGFFSAHPEAFINLITTITKPIIIEFHTVLPEPELQLMDHVRSIIKNVDGIIVMTKNSARILKNDYDLDNMPPIVIIPHGIHLVPKRNKKLLKSKLGLTGKTVLSTFGLLSSGKGIETSLKALPAIISQDPTVVFLILGVTHPVVKQKEGECYRTMLENLVTSLNIGDHVRFVNTYLSLDHLLEYLQLTSIYLFTSNDPKQAVSGTFSYALSSGCAIVSTPFPQALETVTEDIGTLFDFGNVEQLGSAVRNLLKNRKHLKSMGRNAAKMMRPNSWAHSSLKHLKFLAQIAKSSSDSSALEGIKFSS